MKDWKRKQLERKLSIRGKDDLPIAKEILKQKFQTKAQSTKYTKHKLKRFEKKEYLPPPEYDL